MATLRNSKERVAEHPLNEGDTIPEGWGAASVREIVEVKYGKGLRKDRRTAGKVKVYGSNGVVGSHSSALTIGPTIIIGRKGTVGAIHISDLPCWPIDTTFYIDDLSELEPKYIAYAMSLANLVELDTSTAIPGLSRNDLYSQPVDLAPLAEQKRIVAKVEELLAHVSRAREHLDKVPAILKRLRQAVLAAACSGRLTADWRAKTNALPRTAESKKSNDTKLQEDGLNGVNDATAIMNDRFDIPEAWAWRPLSSLGEMNRGKSRHRPRNAPHLFGGPYPFVQTGDVANSGGVISSHKQTYSKAGLAQSRLWPEGTVCITIAANIANSGILSYPACFPDSVVGIIPDKDVVLPEYLEFCIRTVRENLDQFAPATAQKNINIAILNKVYVPIPDVDEQDEIVRRTKAALERIQVVESKLLQAKSILESLAQATLTKAFRGELVPTEAELARQEGRDYEPASVLLDRIRTERQAAALKKKTRIQGKKR